MAFCLGLLGGGLVTATVLVVLGSLLRAPLPAPVPWLLVGLMLIVVLGKEIGWLRIRLPENRRLVPETVFRLGRHAGPFQFGLEMGTGARTYLPSGLPYVAAVAVLFLASVPAALCAGLGFGLGRALMTTANLRFGESGAWDAAWTRHRRVLALLVGLAFLLALLVLLLSDPTVRMPGARSG
ncbi:hypothetical protein M8C13_19620 [Crossiella sp. SN42]|uniref:hypothetical protein n=1 Tax=Crossiella sp. SN42 TaxID=2944808 RepID=UPI00207CEFBE|nr:hypothetical protein [Crossiella sp. SN42]MCO1577964.1 hypothetical protein [Crossiella sp. SN42]